jgi:hypothetical protein
MSDIDISREAVEAAWQNYCEAGNPNGSAGDIDLYDIDGMFEAAQEMNALNVALRAALDAAEAEKARAVGMVEELMAQMDWVGTGDHASAYAEEEGFRQRLAAIRTGAKT